MEKTIVRDVRDIANSDREALEHALGERFRDDQRLVVRVVTLTESTEDAAAVTGDSYASLPEWCDVFAGLSDDEIADVAETTRQRLNLTRESS